MTTAGGGSSRRVVILGGGVTGLSAALALRDRTRETGGAVEVQVLERSSRPGGALSTHEKDGFLLEEGADSLIRTKPAAIRLCERLGIDGDLIPTRPGRARTLIVRGNRLLPLPDGFHLFVPTALWPLVTSRVFSWGGKLRMGLDLVIPRRKVRAGETDDESLASFVRRRLGNEALERLAQPLAAGVWSGDPETMSLRSTMPQLLEMERSHRSIILALRAQIRSGRASSKTAGARYSLFLSLRRGLQQIIDALVAELPPGTIHTGTAANGLERNGAGWIVHTDTGRIPADAVIVALPVGTSARLLGQVDGELGEELAGVPAGSSVTLNLVYEAGAVPDLPHGYGFVCPAVEGRSMLACTFTTRKYEGRSDDRHVILRAFVGGSGSRRLVDADDETITAAIRADLRDLMGIRSEPILRHLSRWNGVFPQYMPGHQQRVTRIEKRVGALPGLGLAGNALRGVGVSDCVDSAQAAARTVLDHLDGDARQGQ